MKASGEKVSRMTLGFVCFFFQQKHTEVERTSKWLKMLRSWDKYKNSDKVISSTFHT